MSIQLSWLNGVTLCNTEGVCEVHQHQSVSIAFMILGEDKWSFAHVYIQSYCYTITSLSGRNFKTQ